MTTEDKDQAFKEIFKIFNYGIYLLGSAYNGSHDLITCTWAMQGSFENGELIVNIGRERPIYSLVKQSRLFSLSILGVDNIKEATICAKSSETRANALKSLQFETTEDDLPFLQNSLAYLKCEVNDVFELESSLLVVGNPIGGKIFSDDDALTLHEYYKLSG